MVPEEIRPIHTHIHRVNAGKKGFDFNVSLTVGGGAATLMSARASVNAGGGISQ